MIIFLALMAVIGWVTAIFLFFALVTVSLASPLFPLLKDIDEDNDPFALPDGFLEEWNKNFKK